MTTFQALLRRLRCAHGDRGTSLVEYALLVSLIALVCFAALQFLGTNNSTSITDSTSAISSAIG